MNQTKKLSVIIPFLNEADALPHLLRNLEKYFSDHPSFFPEVIFVNDGSTDKSEEVLANYKPKSFVAKIVRLSRNFGSHAAIRAGLLHAEGDATVVLTADLQSPLENLQPMYEKILAGYELVYGVRAHSPLTGIQRWLSLAYSWLMRKFALPNFPPSGVDYMMFGRKIRTELKNNVEANSSIFLQVLNLGFRSSVVPYIKASREFGTSKWTLRCKIKLLIDSFVGFSYAPLRFVSILGFLFTFFGVSWGVFIVLRAILANDLTPGWPALVCIMMTGFGATNLSLGIIAEYLWRTLDAARNRPVFIIEQVKEMS